VKNNKAIETFERLAKHLKAIVTSSRKPVASPQFVEVKEPDPMVTVDGALPVDSDIKTLKFDVASLLQPKTFLYLLGVTIIFLAQTYNTLAIINLARESEQLREKIMMISSVVTSQELKVHELHSIHNISQDALLLGLEPSTVPAVELSTEK